MDINTYIIQKLNLENATDDTKQSIVSSIQSIVETRLVLLLDEILTDEQRSEFESIQESRGAVEARLWLEQNVANSQELYRRILDDYLEEKMRNA